MTAENLQEREEGDQLFRSDFLQGTRSSKFGSIRLAQPMSTWTVTTCFSLMAIAIVSFIIFGQVDKKSTVIGITQPVNGSLSIMSQTSGVLSRVFVSEGDIVKAGQPLFEISSARQNSGGDVTALIAAQLDAKSATLVEASKNSAAQHTEKKVALLERLRNLDVEEAQLSAQIVLASRRRTLAQGRLAQYTELLERNFASASQVQEKQEMVIDIDTQISNLLRSQAQLKSSRTNLKAERRDVDRTLKSELIASDRLKAAILQEAAENESRGASVILATRDGVVTTVTYKAGQGILGGQVLGTLVASSEHMPADLEVHLYAASRTAGFITVGQAVNIRYQAYPYQKFGLQPGIVTQVSESPFAPNELPANVATTILNNAQQSSLGLTNNESLYRIRVKPAAPYIMAYGHRQYLKPGMSVDADVIQERRHIWEWIIDPLLALRASP